LGNFVSFKDQHRHHQLRMITAPKTATSYLTSPQADDRHDRYQAQHASAYFIEVWALMASGIRVETSPLFSDRWSFILSSIISQTHLRRTTSGPSPSRFG
jgi:hypothetical protein